MLLSTDYVIVEVYVRLAAYTSLMCALFLIELRCLPLQPEESDRGDLMEAKSQLFLKYFTLFMNLLNDCMEAQEVSSGITTEKQYKVSVTHLHTD